MNYILMSLTNIKKFICYHPVMFSFLFITQIACCTAIFISCGMAYNMEYTEDVVLYYQEFGIYLEKGSMPTSEGYYTDDNGNQVYFYSITDPQTGESIRVSSIEHKDSIPMKKARPLIDEFLNRIAQYKPNGGQIRFYDNVKTVAGVNNQQMFALFPEFDASNCETPYIVNSDERIFTAPIMRNGKKNEKYPYDIGCIYKIGGEDFKCAGLNTMYMYLPYKTVPDDCVVDCIYVMFDNNLFEDDIENIKAIAKELFDYNENNSSIPDPVIPYAMPLSRMLFSIALAVIFIVIMTLIKFYHFIFTNRRETLGIIRLCGCTKGQAHFIYMLEIGITMVLSTIIGFSIFHFMLLDYFIELYPSFKKFFVPSVYFCIIAFYLSVCLIFLTIALLPLTKSSIKDMAKK